MEEARIHVCSGFEDVSGNIWSLEDFGFDGFLAHQMLDRSELFRNGFFLGGTEIFYFGLLESFKRIIFLQRLKLWRKL